MKWCNGKPAVGVAKSWQALTRGGGRDCVMSFLVQLVVLAAVIAMGEFAVGAERDDFPYPSRTIRNEKLSVVVYLPDAEAGFYRSTRFDWSGMIARVDYRGHRFFAPWKSPHNPLDSESVIGPAEEFGMQNPLGFAEAKPGETFIKIGIGHLVRGNDEPYGFWKDYRISKPVGWRIEKQDDSIEFRQLLQDDHGYGYEYRKRISLLREEPGFVIARRLRNTGNRPMQTNHYNHNFTMIDDEPIGPAYRLRFPFSPIISAKEPARLQGRVQCEGRQMMFTDRIEPEKPVWLLLEGHKGVEDHVITIANVKSGGAVKIIGDYPMSRLAFYGASTAACPEPFTEFTLRQGEERTWQTRYVFSAAEEKR